MKKIIALAVAFAAVAVVGSSDANAQTFHNGFQFGAGINAAGLSSGTFFGRGFASRQVRPPYFAEFPPVYYSGIVRRPYGISPFAAPAGVVPVELSHAADAHEPAVVKNPFFNQNKAASASVVEASEEEVKSTKNKSTANTPMRIANPFFSTELKELEPGSILQASFDADAN